MSSYFHGSARKDGNIPFLPRWIPVGFAVIWFQALLSLTFPAWAGNPILKNTDPGFLYAADPSAEVFNGKVYVYCSRDQPDATAYSSMQDYMILETSDMENWTNHGVVLEPRTAAGFEWASGQMNAPDAAYKDGWYYWYFPYDKTHVGVAKSQTPIGPWEPAITAGNAPMTTIFDPTVFVDDDGQAYIYGNDHKVDIGDPGWHVMGAKLKDNMVELDGPWRRLSEETVDEAVTIFKRNGIYYFMARMGAQTGYFMADNPLPYAGNPDSPNPPVHNDPATGHASYQGTLAASAPDAPNHTSAVEFNGKWYFFYHRGDVNDGTSHRRSACVDEMVFNPDGTIQQIVCTLENVVADPPPTAGTMWQEAEDYTDESGTVVEASSDDGGGDQLGYLNHGDWASYSNIDFGSDPGATIPFYSRVSSKDNGGDIELRLDSVGGPLMGTVNVPAFGSWTSYETVSIPVTGVSGVHTLYLVFTGGGGYLLNLNWFSWTPPSPLPLAHWNMDDGAGAVVTDATGHGYDGALSGGSWVLAPDGAHALNFDGTNARVQLPPGAFDSVTSKVTIAMWANGGASQPANDCALRAEDDSGNRMLNIHLPWSNSEVYWDAGDESDFDRVSREASGSEVSGEWNHWVFTKDADAGTMAIYLNGVLWKDEEGSPKNRTVGNITQVTLGSGIGELYYDGMLDDVRIYNTAMSSGQAGALYQKSMFYRSWVESSGLVSTNASILADPEGDGLVNLEEYAFGGNPLGSNSPGIRPYIAMAPSHGDVEYTYRRRLDAADRGLSYVVKATDDLGDPGSWTTDGLSETAVTPLDAEFELVTVEAALDDRGFFRLEIGMDSE